MAHPFAEQDDWSQGEIPLTKRRDKMSFNAKEQTVTPSQVKVKEEHNGDTTGKHLRTFNVKFSKGKETYQIFCTEPCTVLQAIKSNPTCENKMKKMEWVDENTVIGVGEGDKQTAIATHFPCSLTSDGELLTVKNVKTNKNVKTKKETVEKVQDHRIDPNDEYVVFYIDKEGGENCKSGTIFRNNTVQKFKFLCVYGKKEMTVEEALKCDGRFRDDIGDFSLSNNENNRIISRTEKVTKIHNMKLKIRKEWQVNKDPRGKEQQGNQCASNKSQQQCGTKEIVDVAQQRRITVTTSVEKRGKENTEEIYQILCLQFPDLKKWMESRFLGDSYQKAVNLRKENFGKIQQSFSEVHTVRNLIKLGESVCRIEINCSSLKFHGTGFVLFDNFVLTNAHLFKPCADLQGDNWQEGTKITVTFNYENTDSESNQNSFNVSIFSLGDNDLDYAILELMGRKHSQKTETEETKVPPGLLKKFGPLPESGGACIIGHLKGEVKKMDLTCIIEKDNREQAVNSNLEDYKDYLFTLCSINQAIKNDPFANDIVTYNTFMFHGSSGSPVFNAYGQVFGLHTAGFFFGFPKPDQSVIEFAHPLLTIFRNFVRVLKETGHEEVLKRVQEKAKGNSHLEKVLESVVGSSEVKAKEESYLTQLKVEPVDPDESADEAEPMQTD